MLVEVVGEFIQQALMQEQVVLVAVVLVEVESLFLVVLQHIRRVVEEEEGLIVQMVATAVLESL